MLMEKMNVFDDVDLQALSQVERAGACNAVSSMGLDHSLCGWGFWGTGEGREEGKSWEASGRRKDSDAYLVRLV